MTDFATVRSEGGLLPPDLLARVAAGDAELGGLASEDYGLARGDRVGEAAARAWGRAKAYWAAFRAARESLAAGETGVTETRQQWLIPLLRELGYRDLEFRAAAEAVDGRAYRLSHRSGPLPLDLLGFREDLDRAGATASGERRMSPHARLQEYLNVSDGLYGLVSNGLRLRLLRDNASLTRQAYVEFDLEGMLEGGAYADFVLLYMTLHRSRLPRRGAEASDCWLERWRARAEAQGARALGELRRGVEAAIVSLGSGFLHPSNETLRQRLLSGDLSVQGYYQQLLRLVYRLIFLYAAEERGLLFPSGASAADRGRYAENYGASRLRRVARRYLADDRHDDLWRGLRITFQLLSGERAGLGVPALGGGLFDAESCPDLDGALLRNDALAEAVRQLSWVRVARVARWVNYRDMDAEELGGVYEGLLERQPQMAADAVQPRFDLVGSGQRKQTGSYYTPASLVRELIRSALEPVIAERLKGKRAAEERRRALLGITVGDPACGSGHFLLAAARAIADELARAEAGDREPGPEERRAALRDVIRNCIYGVDVNPLAVDLCRLSLWLEGHFPGKPLAFLESHIKVGNSLIGATPELVAGGIPDGAFDPVSGDDRKAASGARRRNRQARDGQLDFSSDLDAWATLRDELALEALEIAAAPEDGLARVAEQRARYDAYQRERVEPARLALDAWTATFFWPLSPNAPPAPTTADLPANGGPHLSPAQCEMVRRLRAANSFFHWPLEFPEVFADGGFDCVLGNPPWERIKLQEQEFFDERDPQIAKAPNKAARQRLIDTLPQRDPTLARAFEDAKRLAECQSKFARGSDRFPLTATGDINLYAIFAESDRLLINARGRAGIVVPTGVATDNTTRALFGDLVLSGSLVSYFGFKNEQHLFPMPVEHTVTFGLLTMLGVGRRSERMEFTWFAYNTDHMNNPARRVQLSAEDFALFNPNTRTCPIFRTAVDAELTRAIYRRVPVLVNERTGENPWGVQFLAMFHMSNDSHLFHDHPGLGLVPLYEGRMIHLYDHRFGTFDSSTGDYVAVPNPKPERVKTQYWVDRELAEERLARRGWNRQWLYGFRRIARNTDVRTVIGAVVPRTAATYGLYLAISPIEVRRYACLLGMFNSMTFDYLCRNKPGQPSLTYGVVYQLPALRPSLFAAEDVEFVTARVLELSYTARDLEPFARDLGYGGPAFRWDEERRAVLRAELDAYYAALYGLTRDELRYILDPRDVHGPDFPGETFRVLKEREIKQYGEYRTRRLVLEAWDRLGLGPRNREGRDPPQPIGSQVGLHV